VRAEVLDPATLAVEFELPSGAYATTVLDQLVQWRVAADELEGDLDAGDD
jgi:tRNA(Glu) U13 pseudouridine synthase TruD